MAGAEKWDLQSNGYYGEQSTGFVRTSFPLEYKLYVRPIAAHYDEKFLEDIFSVYGKIKEVYISTPVNEAQFRWAFISYDDRASAEEAMRMVNDCEDYDFKIEFAKEKSKKIPKSNAGNASMNYSYVVPRNLILPEAKATPQVNGVSYVTPPNCRFCKKLTIFSCSSCGNPFCNTECSIDGWRFHTSECIKVANLVHTEETKKVPIQANGANPNISDTVVSFMKNIRDSKKGFHPDEFAASCRPAAKPNESVDNDRFFKPIARSELALKPSPKSEHNPKPFSKSSEHNHKPFSKSTERNHHRDDTDSFRFKKPFSGNYSQRNDSNHSALPRTKYESGSESDERSVPNGGHRRDSDSHIAFRKKSVTERSAADRSVSHNAPAKRRSDSDTERIRNFQPRDRLQCDDSKENVPRENRPPKEKAIQPLTDLNLQTNETREVIVTSVIDDTTFFIADPQKSTAFMTKFNEIADELARLENVRIGTLCLGNFDDGWYRAKIVSVDPLKVLYIDFGNEEIVDRDSLKHMPQKFIRTLPLACKVQLRIGNVKAFNIAEFKRANVRPVEFDNERGIWFIDIL